MRQSMGFYRKHHAELAEKIRKAELQNKQRRLEYLRKQQAQTEQEIEELS
jgi:hypothetical protein